MCPYFNPQDHSVSLCTSRVGGGGVGWFVGSRIHQLGFTEVPHGGRGVMYMTFCAASQSETHKVTALLCIPTWWTLNDLGRPGDVDACNLLAHVNVTKFNNLLAPW